MALSAAFWHTAEMLGPRGFGCIGCQSGQMRVFFGCVLLLALAAAGACAQEQSTPTLHVYTDLVQVPVLVLSQKRARMAPIPADRFYVSIDSGPNFRATHVRQEGDDPISLGILVDLSGPETQLLPELERVLEGTATPFLQERDRVSVSIMDCSLVTSAEDVPARPDLLKQAMDDGLRAWKERAADTSMPRCGQTIHLWDAMMKAVGDLSRLPGRRVLLAITDGQDEGSKEPWNRLRYFAQLKGVAIFGMSYWPNFNTSGLLSERFFDSICELSGGMVFRTDKRTFAEQVELFLTMLRERYIVEFPRPVNGTPGQHGLTVTIKKSHNFIRPAGVNVALPDAAVLSDPSTIPSDPSRKPVIGSRRILTRPQ